MGNGPDEPDRVNRTATRPRRAPASRPDLTEALSVLVVAATAAVAVWLVVGPLQLPERVDVTVDNDTPFDLVVEAGTPDGAGSVVLGTAGRGREIAFRDKVDQGDEWVFSFSYGGVDAGAVQLGRAELESSGWRVTVPRRVADVLVDAGLGPTA